MFNFTSAEVIANGIKLHYYRTGGRKPPLVLVHGITDDGLCWTPVAEVLSGNYDIIMVDVRGHGKSEAPEAGYTLENLANDLASLCLALELENPIFLGHSMGAIASLILASLFPNIPGAILLEDPPAFWCFDPRSAGDIEFRNGLAKWIDGNKRKTRDDLLIEGVTNNPHWSEAELEPWVNAKHRYSPRISALINPDDILSIGFPDILKRITCPALLISAEKQLGSASSEDEIAKLKTLLPQLQIEHIPGAGHSIRRDQFAQYIEVVQRFLTSIQPN